MEAGTHKSPPSISVRIWSSSIYLGTRQIHPAAGTTDPSPSLRKSRMPFPSWCPGGIFEDISCPQKTPAGTAELYLHLNVSLCVRRPKWWIWTTNSSGKVHFLLNLSGRHPQHLIAGESHLMGGANLWLHKSLVCIPKKENGSWFQLQLNPAVPVAPPQTESACPRAKGITPLSHCQKHEQQSKGKWQQGNNSAFNWHVILLKAIYLLLLAVSLPIWVGKWHLPECH